MAVVALDGDTEFLVLGDDGFSLFFGSFPGSGIARFRYPA
jgi:hypothetical protein